MPSTINGIGTSYRNNRNVVYRSGRCEHCGTHTTLSSYDTTLSFVVLFIPVIPLSDKHISRQCPKCTRHQVAPMNKWHEIRDREIAQALEQSAAAPTDVAAAIHVIETLVEFDAQSLFIATIAALPASHAQNGEFVARLGLGYHTLGMKTEAVNTYHAALAVRPPDALVPMVIDNLLRISTPESVAEHAAPYITGPDPLSRDVLRQLVEAYQAGGKHGRVLNLYDEFGDTVESASDATLVRLRGISEKYKGGSKKVAPAAVPDPVADGIVRKRRWRTAALVGGLAMALVLVYGVATWYHTVHRKIWLLNGTTQPYALTVNGKPIMLAPQWPSAVEVSEGDVVLTRSQPGKPDETTTVDIHTPILERAFNRTTFVVNVDRMAILVQETVTYSTGTPPVRPPTFTRPPLLYSVSGLDHSFEPFPQTVRVKAGTTESRTGIDMVRSNGRDLLYFAEDRLGEATGTALAKQGIAVDPACADYYQYLLTRIKPDELLAEIQPLLSARPPLVHAHRAYQIIAPEVDPKVDVAARYTEYADANPSDPGFAYLAGRVLSDPAKSRVFYNRSLAASTPEPMAYRAVANDQLAAGEFAEALVTCQDAAAKGVPKSVMARPHCQSLAALGRLNDAVTIAEERAFRSSEDFGISDRAFLLLAVGRRGDAESILTLASGADGPVTRETQAAQRAVSWLIACCLGVPEVPADFDPSKPNAIAFDVGLVTKNFELAKSSIRAAAEAQDFNYSAWSLLAVAAGAAKNENVLRESAAQMAKVLTKVPTPAMHGIGLALETDPQSAMDWVRRSPADASQRALLYAAIGFLHPSHRAECFALAAKHNYWPDKYQKLLDAWLKAARE